MTSSLHPLLEHACRFFDLGPLLSADDAGGYANRNLLVETGRGSFVARILREHSPDDLKSEIHYLEHLASLGFPCPRYLTGQGGNALFEDDRHVVAVMPFLDGKVVEDPPAAQIAALGAALARLHRADSGPLEPRKTWWRPDFLGTGLITAKARFGDQALARLETRIAELPDLAAERLPRSILHGDPWPGNALFDGEDLAALIDWEETTLGPPILDLAYLALHGCASGGVVDPHGLRSLFEAYQAVRPLSPEERRCLGPAVRRIACVNYLWLVLKTAPAEDDLEALWASQWYWGLDLDGVASAVSDSGPR